MKELLKYELYKIFSRKSIYLAAVFFLIIYGIFISTTANTNSRDNYRYYKNWIGTLTEEKVRAAQDGISRLQAKSATSQNKYEVNLTGEEQNQMNVYKSVMSANKEKMMRSSYMEGLQKQIQDIKKDDGKKFDYNAKLLEYNMMKSLQEPGVYYNLGVSGMVDFPDMLGFIFLGALVLLGVSPVFSEEYAVNTDALILSSKNGRKKDVTAKIAASVIFIISALLFFSTVNALANIYLYGAYGFDAPLQSLFGYVLSPYSLSIGQYYLIQVGVNAIGLTAFGLTVLFISSLSKSPLVTLFIGSIVYLMPEAARSIFPDQTGFIASLIRLSYAEVVKTGRIFKMFKAYDVFTMPVLYPVVATLAMVISSIIVVYFIYRRFKNIDASLSFSILRVYMNAGKVK